MADPKNPYSVSSEPAWLEATASNVDARVLPDHRVPESIMNLLEKTRAWILFFSLIGFVLTALFAFISAFLIFGGFVTSASLGSGFFAASACYVLVAVIFGIPSHFLWQLSYWIQRASMQPTWRELEEVVRAHRIFWQVTGTLVASLISLFICLVVYYAIVF